MQGAAESQTPPLQVSAAQRPPPATVNAYALRVRSKEATPRQLKCAMTMRQVLQCHPSTIPAREQARGPTRKSQTLLTCAFDNGDVVEMRLNVEPELDHVAVLHDVVLALHAGLAGGAGVGY